jgi:beclin 1
LENEQKQYTDFLQSLEQEKEEEANENKGDIPTIEQLQAEEKRLKVLLLQSQVDMKDVEYVRKKTWQNAEDLDALIRGTFAEGAFLQHLLALSRDERQSVDVFSVHASDMLRRLQRYNVCNDVFHIWHDGNFGTINGLRLGRLPSKPVEWIEINAALGQAVLLLATIAERSNLEFTRNKLIPRGSYSRVVNMYGKEYYLFSDGGMFRRRGFNQAMILFLECVDDAGKRAMREEPTLKFPYKISRGKIGDMSISLGNDEEWTKALKYMLTHLKWLLAWVAKRYP